MTSVDVSQMDRDILRIIMDSQEPATSRTIAESYYRCETSTGPSNIHGHCVSLKEKGLLDSDRTPLGESSRNVMTWNVTEEGRTVVDRKIPEEKETPSETAEEIPIADTTPDEIQEEESGPEDTEELTQDAEPDTCESSETEDEPEKPTLHPETVEYLTGFIDTLHQIEECVKAGRFSDARAMLKGLPGLLDPESILAGVDFACPLDAGRLIAASDIMRGSE